jgi:type I restriction enzyme S subunit
MSEWRECKLGDAPLEIVDGDRGKNYPSQDEFQTNGYCLFLSTKNVRVDGFDFSDCQYISKERDELLRKGKLKRNDVVLTTRGTIGNIGFFDNSVKFDHIRINSGMVIIRPNEEELSPSFNYYVFRKLQKNDFHTFTSGSAQPQLPIRDLTEIEISLPPLPEQKAIAAVLSSLDDKIDLLHRQNKTLEAMAETLFKQWFDSQDCNGTIFQLLTIQNGYAFKSKDFNEQGEYGVLKIKNISASIVDIKKTDFISSTVSDNTPERFKVNTGDILIAMTGAEIGKLGIVPKTNKVLWLNQRVGLLREKYKGSKYLAYLQLKSEFGQDYIQNTATGSAQPNISGTGIESCGFPFVSEDKIKEYSEKIDSFYERLIFNLGQIQTLETLRDNLLPKLMSGEVRVKLTPEETPCKPIMK